MWGYKIFNIGTDFMMVIFKGSEMIYQYAILSDSRELALEAFKENLVSMFNRK